MNISIRLKAVVLFGMTLCFVSPMTVIAQTFSPYTSGQIQEFNNQPIALMETPAGPVYIERPPISQRPNIPFDTRYIKNPDGEEQTEAQGAQSAAPFEPIPATITFQ